jgi:uncharacterized protein (DUF2252 family)
MNQIFNRIEKFNLDRDRDLVKLKYQKMRLSPFSFFRGSCHIFYADWQQDSELNNTPLAWLCGDLHLQNFGSYKGENRFVYFDINDFDEAILAPCGLDLTRLVTSIFLAFPHYQEGEETVDQLAKIFVTSYQKALAEGKARWVDQRTATELVQELLEETEQRKRKSFLDDRTKIRNGKREIFIKQDKTRPILSETKKLIEAALNDFARSTENPEFFEVLDVSERIAGTGSLGLKRYLVLIEGKGSPDANYLLDIKASRPPSAIKYLKNLNFPQKIWQNEAERIINIQQKLQAISPAFLQTLKIDNLDCVMRELQPHEDKIEWEDEDYGFKKIRNSIATIGEVVAWAQLRSSGREGSANADELIEFAQQDRWQKQLLEYAKHYSSQVEKDWQEFCRANSSSDLS